MSTFDLFYACFHIGITVEPQRLAGKWGLRSSWPKPFSVTWRICIRSNLIWRLFAYRFSFPGYWSYCHCAIWKQVCHKTCLFAFSFLQRVVAEAEIYRPCFGLGAPFPGHGPVLILKCLDGKSFKVNFYMFGVDNRYLYRYSICTQDILVPTNILLLSCANVSKIMTTRLRPTLGQVAPCLSKPYQSEPSGQFGTRQCQLSRCSTGPSRVSKEEVYRQEEFKTLPSLSPQNTSVMPSRWPGVTGVSSSLLGFFPRASHHPACALQMQARVPWPWSNSPE